MKRFGIWIYLQYNFDAYNKNLYIMYFIVRWALCTYQCLSHERGGQASPPDFDIFLKYVNSFGDAHPSSSWEKH